MLIFLKLQRDQFPSDEWHIWQLIADDVDIWKLKTLVDEFEAE